MDVTTLQVVSAGQGAPVSALPAASSNISAQALQVVNNIAADTAISPAERTALVQAVASFDQAVHTKSIRETLFANVQGLGTYLRQTSTTGWPRWHQMTALRAYGLNLVPGKNSGIDENAIAQQTRAQLEAAAQAARNVSLQQAVAAAKAPAPAPVVVQQVAVQQVKVETKAPVAEAVEVAPAAKVDTLV